MKVKLPFITKDEIQDDGRRVFEYRDKDVAIDNTLNAQMRWEARFPELAERESIVDYSCRIKQVESASLTVIISKLKVLYCFLDAELTFEQFLKMFDYSQKEYVEKLIERLTEAFEAIFDAAAEKN